jgi:ComF family protein
MNAFNALLSFLFPDRCVGCGGWGALFCQTCLRQLSPYPHDSYPAQLDAVYVAWIYGGPLQHAIHALKYKGQRRVAAALADHLMAAMLRPATAAVLLPVPLHADRLVERGFNQSAEIAVALGRRWRMPVLDNALIRSRDTGHQAKLARRERASNVAGAFVWRLEQPPPENVILIDDVLTTGATLAACADALRAAGCASVSALALARSRPDLAAPRAILKPIILSETQGGVNEHRDKGRSATGSAVRDSARAAPARPRVDHRGRRAGG